jgi:hypothetical protein
MQAMTNPSTHPAATQAEAAAPRSGEARHTPVWNFTRHYIEMLAAMFLGMLVLGGALAVPLELAGADVSNWDRDAPALLLLGMAFAMTVPMVAWMRHRGHGWAPAADMTAAMFLPSFAAVGLLWAGLETDTHALLMIQHVAMGPAMLVAMLLRRHEYTGHH